MNKIIKQESSVNVFGVDARAANVVANEETGRILNQKISAVRYFKDDRTEYKIIVKMRFDDECGNGHETFSITGDILEKTARGWRDDRSGCIHEDIEKRFPELAHLIKWHLVSTDGPRHYLSNTTYHASNRDYDGLLAGEPNLNPVHMQHGIKFQGVPIVHNVKKSFFEFIQQRSGSGDFQPVPIAYAGKDYDFAPKWTLCGYGEKWHDCPFDSKEDAYNFAEALNTCSYELVTWPGVFGKGKARDFESARRSAIWPEATDEQLSLDKPELTKLLQDRLPALMAEFKSDMVKIGFVYPE